MGFVDRQPAGRVACGVDRHVPEEVGDVLVRVHRARAGAEEEDLLASPRITSRGPSSFSSWGNPNRVPPVTPHQF